MGNSSFMRDVKGSSNVSFIGHDGIGVVVEFKGGQRYRYVDAPASMVEQCLKAESAGKFVSKNLVRGTFKAVKLGDGKKQQGGS